MALARAERQITWPTAANTGSVGATSGSVTSEEFNVAATAVQAQVTLKADNGSTPAADDIVYFWLLQTSGDPDGAGSDEFDTVGHAKFLGRIDTNAEDPGILTVPLPLPQKGGKIYAEGITAGNTNAITVSATITEQTDS